MWGDGAMAMASQVDSDTHWTVGSPAIGRAVARGAFAFCLFCVAGTVGLAPDLLHIPGLLGHPVDARASLCLLAWLCTVCGVALVPLLARLQRANVHTGGGEVT